MDTRGIEVTNQLRSAIRAKLMELGVRYDEELPDYILVMVVNKKSRQQMHDDLNLFLEDCTTIFVDWLHDQVLKKLQKVTVAKKKSSREFVPTVVVKQEEEKKKRKITTTSFLEDQTVDQPAEKSTAKNVRDDKAAQKQQTCVKSSLPTQSPEQSHNKGVEKNAKIVHSKGRADELPTHVVSQQEAPPPKKPQQSLTRDANTTTKENPAPENSGVKTGDSHHDQRASEVPAKSLKRSLETPSSGQHDGTEKKDHEAKRPKSSEEEKEEDAATSSSDTARKLKSCVNKPRITSVVSVKNRLGVMSPRKKFEIYREKTAADGNSRHRQLEKRFDKYRYDNSRGGGGGGGGGGFQRNRSFEADDRSRRNRDSGGGGESRYHETNKINDVRSRIESNKNERLERRNAAEPREKTNTSSKTADIAKKSTCNIKDRLGLAGIGKTQKQSIKLQETVDYRNSKNVELARDNSSNSKNIKNRLGPLRNNFQPVRKTGAKQSRSSEDDDCLNLGDEEEEELDNDDQSAMNAGPIKSHIVAVNRSAIATRIERKRPKASEIPFNAIQHPVYPGHGGKMQSDKTNRGTPSDVDEDTEDMRLPSKVIVTPRPLKPLQPTQKRATQSLLLRAVAEANQSVVKQKNPEPSLLDKKSALKRLKPAPTRDVSQNLSVHLNSSKRLVMEKIQIELNTVDNMDVEGPEPAPYVPQAVTEEHMGVVMSLFQRSDDNQKFLVTLNGYNNNLMKEKIGSEDDEERLEMEVNEDDELALLTTHNESYATVQSTELNSSGEFRIMDGPEDDMDANSPKETSDENNENCNTENVDKTDEAPRKRRKLSPIIYNRSHTPSPTRSKSNTLLSSTLPTKLTDKKPLAEGTVPALLDKSRENCRYWPNCTLGNKCAYLHPPVMCSAFPACKFGDKCAYRHPKCKFGLSCTKLGCVFSHPAQQCKYHPFCTKPACPYSHPATSHAPALTVETTSQRAKFTWRRQE